jgi:hypothetical protein
VLEVGCPRQTRTLDKPLDRVKSFDDNVILARRLDRTKHAEEEFDNAEMALRGVENHWKNSVVDPVSHDEV